MKTTISITIDVELLQELKKLADNNFTSVSQEIRNIIRVYLKEHSND